MKVLCDSVSIVVEHGGVSERGRVMSSLSEFIGLDLFRNQRFKPELGEFCREAYVALVKTRS